MISSSPTALSLPRRTPRIAARPPVIPPARVEPRFTHDGGIQLEQHLAVTCEKIAAGLRGLIPGRKLEAVLLGGGYGRGEGGVLQTPAGARPYNDLEFYVCLRGNRHWNERRFGRALHVLGEILTPQAGVDVEFKITSLREFRRSSVSMFSYDLMMGHRWLIGDERLLAGCTHHCDAQRIPFIEATRLLMNRCSGLLFAAGRLEQADFSTADADFVCRNIAKAKLALGDAILVMRHEYHWSVRERHARIVSLEPTAAMPWLIDVCRHHDAGCEFKLHPIRSTASRAELAAVHADVTERARHVWLWIEQQRMCARFETARDYAESALNKVRDSSRRRNVLVNLRALGVQPMLEGRATRHPRERIFNVLALLLWERQSLGTPDVLRFVQRELQTAATSIPSLLDAYRELWSKVN